MVTNKINQQLTREGRSIARSSAGPNLTIVAQSTICLFIIIHRYEIKVELPSRSNAFHATRQIMLQLGQGGVIGLVKQGDRDLQMKRLDSERTLEVSKSYYDSFQWKQIMTQQKYRSNYRILSFTKKLLGSPMEREERERVIK